MGAPQPRPLSDWSPPGDLLGVLCDIDDTLTHEGRIVPGALQALHALQASGLRVIPVTGRPGGWVVSSASSTRGSSRRRA